MNRLATEQSPYLLQHADNPVEWYPWGDEAFARARRESRPIFLSVGYSTCHWCHVMEHESFENQEIAEILNREFVPIKVDREERPDVDRVYMAFVQATTGTGGWPMSVWLTPDLEPFYGGTYFPPTAQWGRPGFAQVLTELARVWNEERDRVVSSAETITARLRAAATGGARGAVPPAETLGAASAQFAQVFDARHGGFGDAPKFPRPAELYFLLREDARAGDERARQMAVATLRAMALGGVRDHVGGGFHRYAVDARWRVPHFEKMLYDQAQLVLAYLEAAQAAGDPLFAQVAEDTLQYVRREMTHPDGGFYSAQDADSLAADRAGQPGARKTEGAFYLWHAEEIAELSGDDADLVMRRFGVDPDGNAPEDPHGEFVGRNILYVARSLDELARDKGLSVDEVTGALNRARLAMYQARMRRPRPHLDDKVLTSWNGLMMAALARAARVLSNYGTTPADSADGIEEDLGAAHLEAARRAARFLRTRMWNPRTGTLLRRYRGGDAAIAGYAEDYAFLVWGLLELFQSDPDPAWLEWAITLQRRQDELFWDAEAGGWFSTTGDDPSVLVRMKEDYDGAEPSATSAAVSNLLTLAHLSPALQGTDAGFADRIEAALGSVAGKLPRFARSLPMMLAALSTYHAGVRQLVIVGPPDREDTEALLDAAHAVYQPFAVVVRVGPGAHQQRLARVLPWIGPLEMRDGRATAYVCRDFVCEVPVTSPDALVERLGAR